MMIYARIDVVFRDHPKALAAGPIARDLWVWGNLYSRDHQTDGALPRDAVLATAWGAGPRRKANLKVAAKLVTVGLWHVTDGGWAVTNYAAKNDTKAVISARKQQTNDRVKRFRNALQSRGRNASVPDLEESESESESLKEKDLSVGEPTLSAVNKNALDEIYEHWLDHRKAFSPRSGRISMIARDRKNLAQLLRLGRTTEEMKLACAGHFLSPLHTGQGDDGRKYIAFEYVLRPKNVDEFISLAENQEKPLKLLTLPNRADFIPKPDESIEAHLQRTRGTAT